MTAFDQSTWMAHRAIQAAELANGETPAMVALPGAKAPIQRARLDALLKAGHDTVAIVARVNAQWERDNAHLVEQRLQWVTGPYDEMIRVERELEAERKAEDLHRRARITEKIRAQKGSTDAR